MSPLPFQYPVIQVPIRVIAASPRVTLSEASVQVSAFAFGVKYPASTSSFHRAMAAFTSSSVYAASPAMSFAR